MLSYKTDRDPESVLGAGFLSFSMIASHFLSKMWGVTRAKLLTKCQMFLLKSAPEPKHAMYVRYDVERARLVVLVLRCGAESARLLPPRLGLWLFAGQALYII